MDRQGQRRSSPTTRLAALAGPRAGTALFHIAAVLSLMAVQAVYAPARWINSDNNWHFRLAKEVLSPVPLFWSAVDGNRLFPDLLYSLAALVLPGGSDYRAWLLTYYLIYAGVLYLGLFGTSRSVFETEGSRRGFLFLSVAAVCCFLLAAPFWDNWLVIPGNHGGAFPVCLICFGLVLSLKDSATAARAAAFILLAMLVIASNRALFVTIFAPLCLAILAVWSFAQVRPGSAGAGSGLLRQGALAAGGCAAGLVGWWLAGHMGWHKLVAPVDVPELFSPDPLDWLATRARNLATALGASPKEIGWDVYLGLAVLLLPLPAAALLLLSGVRSPADQNRLILATSGAVGALLSLALVLVTLNLTGAWQFRFLTTPTLLALVTLVSLATAAIPAIEHWPRTLVTAGLAVLPALATGAAAGRQAVFVAEEKALGPALHHLEEALRAHAPSSDPVMRGLSEYWVANKVTARSRVVHVDNLRIGEPRVLLFLNNAYHLCQEGHFFILIDIDNDDPKTSVMTQALDEPLATELVDLPWAWRVEGEVKLLTKHIKILFYDPAVIAERIVRPSREAAAKLFPDFPCPAKPPQEDQLTPARKQASNSR